MQALNENTTIKLSIDHNISSMKVIEARYDLNQTILAVKYGSVLSFIRLQLKDIKNNLIAQMDEDFKTLGSYGAQTGMVLHVIDLNPQSIHKQIESYEGVQKYVMSEEDYDNLPENFRKWKEQLIKSNPQLFQQNKQKKLNLKEEDPQYLQQLASTLVVGSRCKMQNGARGQICYIGKIMDLGNGYYVGVKLDQPFGNSNGSVKGVKYFLADEKYATFVRPNTLQVGDFPVLDIDDQI